MYTEKNIKNRVSYAPSAYKSTESSEMLHRGLKAKMNFCFNCTILRRDSSDHPASLGALGKKSYDHR